MFVHFFGLDVHKTIGRSEIEQGTGAGFSNFNQSINWHHHLKDHVEIGHLTKYDAFRVNKYQAMTLEIWLKIDTNVPNFETASPKKPYKLLIFVLISVILFKMSKQSDFYLRLFQIVGEWRDFTVVTKLIENLKSLHCLFLMRPQFFSAQKYTRLDSS